MRGQVKKGLGIEGGCKFLGFGMVLKILALGEFQFIFFFGWWGGGGGGGGGWVSVARYMS